MRKKSDINSFYYFNEVLDFNWLDVRMMCWVRDHLRISHSFYQYETHNGIGERVVSNNITDTIKLILRRRKILKTMRMSF